MTISSDYPINWYSRVASDKSTSGPASLWFFNHADLASISSGTLFSDVSPYNHQVYDRGSAIIQTTTQKKFGDSSIILTGSTISADAARIVWQVPFFSASTATPFFPAFQIESWIYFTSLPTTNRMYWFDFRKASASSTFNANFHRATSGEWLLHVSNFTPGLGEYLNADWYVPEMTSGVWHHFGIVSVNTEQEALSPGQISCFQNAINMVKVAGAFPTGGDGEWVGRGIDLPDTNRLAWGGLAEMVDTVGFYTLPGYIDEMRILYDGLDGLLLDGSTFNFTVGTMTVAHTPASGSFNVSTKTLSLTSSTLQCTTNAGLALGTVTSRWADVYVGSANKVYFGTATSIYVYSSTSIALTIAAPAIINVQANLSMVGRNIETGTGGGEGIRIGITTNSRIGFFNATPFGRPTSTTDLKDLIVQLGFQADGDPTDLDLDGGGFITTGSSTLGQLLILDGKNLLFGTTTGTIIGTTTNVKLSFYGTTPVVRQTALSAQLTTLTFTSPTVADYAIQDLINVAPYGFVTADEGQTLISTIANLQTRVSELETRLKAYGLLA